jgi:hypothetical protein
VPAGATITLPDDLSDLAVTSACPSLIKVGSSQPVVTVEPAPVAPPQPPMPKAQK